MEKSRKVNCPSHDRVCNDRIRNLNHLVRAGMTHEAVTENLNVLKITISRLMIRLQQKQVRRMTDPVTTGHV